MATLKKTIGLAVDLNAVGDSKFTIENVYPYTHYTVEVHLTGITIGGGAVKPTFEIQGSEVDSPADGDYKKVGVAGVTYLLDADAGASVLKFHIVGLKTRNFAVAFIQNDLDGGTMDEIIVTAGQTD